MCEGIFVVKTFDYFITDIYNKYVRQCSVLFGRTANTGGNGKNMARIVIHKLGPVDHCEMEISRFTVLTGAQASGKSTAAKAVFFCRTVKDDIYDIVLRQLLPGTARELRNDTIRCLHSKFQQMFGDPRTLDAEMKVEYYYGDQTYIRISHPTAKDGLLQFEFSQDIEFFLQRVSVKENADRNVLRFMVNSVFQDEYETLFIPSGRSVIALLTSQLSYLFATMDDEQKQTIDYCTQKYIERVLRIRPLFENGISGLIRQKQNTAGAGSDYEIVDKMLELIYGILKGRYVYKDGEERLYITDSQYVKMSYTSSGQQETVWLFNILLHLMVNHTKAYIILEEPEAHLYPQSQKSMVELLALFFNQSCGVMLTTHSPYILGALNNLIYAAHLSGNKDFEEGVAEKVDPLYWVKEPKAWFLAGGEMKSCMEPEQEGGLIVNEVIDGASAEINALYDRLFDMEYRREESV